MDENTAAEKNSVVNFHVPSEQNVVSQNDVVCNSGVMAEVDSHHQQIVRTDYGIRAFLCAPMDRAIFTNHVAVPDLHSRSGFGIEAQILRKCSDDYAVTESIVFPYSNRTRDHGMALNLRARTDSNWTFNQCVRTNAHIGIEFRLWIDNGSGMDHPEYFSRQPAALVDLNTVVFSFDHPVQVI